MDPPGRDADLEGGVGGTEETMAVRKGNVKAQAVAGDPRLPPSHPINLRKQVHLTLDPSFSVKSYIGAASTLLEKAQMADAQGNLVAAFVHYLTTASVASFVPKHAEWASVKQQRGPTFLAYQELMNRTPYIVERAQIIEKELKTRAEQEIQDTAQRPEPESTRPRSPPPPPTPAKPPLPAGPCVSVEELWTFMYPGFDKAIDGGGHERLIKRPGLSLLLLDVRARRQHEAGHIRGADTVCVDPSQLPAPPVTAAELQALLLPSEAALWAKRTEYDVLVLYDQRTRTLATPGNATPEQTYLDTILRALEPDVSHNPVLLRGGFESWARQVGEAGVVATTSASGEEALAAVRHARLAGYSVPTKPATHVPPRVPPRSYQGSSEALPPSLVSGRRDYPTVPIATSGAARSSLAPPPPAMAPRTMPDTASSGSPAVWRDAAPSFPRARDIKIGLTGLKNFGNTCYMNATIQCLSATLLLSQYLLDGTYKTAINTQNPLGTRGALAHALAQLLRTIWSEQYASVAPSAFRDAIGRFAPLFQSHEQQDSQEFLTFLLDGLHEDLNRVLQRPPALELGETQQAELNRLPPQLASVVEWSMYRRRNDSVVVDTFQGQLRNQLTCLTCGHTSTTYNAFMSLSLPVPTGRGVTQATLTQCLDAFVREEVLEKANAWHCPKCKKPRRSTKRLSLARLPPVLLVHLKRFTYRGPVSNKIDTRVVFPTEALDLSNYMPPPLPPGSSVRGVPASESQRPPYLYELYGVTHHFGSLTSGHYTASVRTQGLWYYCDDQRITPGDAQIHTASPYLLFFRRRPP
ncbi:ubiquitinyl hydrolase 1 [Malassezia nana]|uniref:Ubiquitin carboxyl-terminal hydrolase n=1 Tax=Malassezia nana TaxID=180528 RepID=A0AAF0EJM8_9BASI|nr:ubiquitinyl hydrolase 1 [Malassezia nana]